MKTKRINHTKIYNKICKKFSLSYSKGQGWIYPTNYTYFYIDDVEIFHLENIPAGTYLKTVRLGQYWDRLINEKKIENFIHSLYMDSRDTKWDGYEWAFYSNNYNELF